MESVKVELINKIIYSMSSSLTADQINKLSNVLTTQFHEVSVEPLKCELKEYDNYDQVILEQYYASLVVEGKSKKTIYRYLTEIKKMLRYVEKPIKQIQTSDLRYYLVVYQQEHKVSNTTLDGTRKCLRAFFSWAEDNDYVIKSPARRIKSIKHDTVQEPALTQGQLEQVMDQARDNLDRALITFLYDTAARVDEVSNIQFSEIDFRSRTVLLHGKGGKDRTVFFTDKAEFYLQRYLAERNVDSNYLFATKHAKRISNQCIESRFRRIGERCDVGHFHPHRMRVTRITHLIDRGMPIQDVQEFAGHASIATTKMYYRNRFENIKFSYSKVA